MKLSILIPTLEDRKESLYKLLSILLGCEFTSDEQCDCVNFAGGSPLSHFVGFVKNECQIIYERDNGQLSVGTKRQKLLERAKGDYIAFIDDDDMVPDDYVARVLAAIEDYNEQWGEYPDCCSLTGELHWLGNNTTEPFEHSIKHQKWEKQDGVYLRYPNHLNAVRRDLALQVGFKDMGHGEDRDYSDRLKPLLKTEAPIDGVIYHYNCRG